MGHRVKLQALSGICSPQNFVGLVPHDASRVALHWQCFFCTVQTCFVSCLCPLAAACHCIFKQQQMLAKLLHAEKRKFCRESRPRFCSQQNRPSHPLGTNSVSQKVQCILMSIRTRGDIFEPSRFAAKRYVPENNKFPVFETRALQLILLLSIVHGSLLGSGRVGTVLLLLFGFGSFG